MRTLLTLLKLEVVVVGLMAVLFVPWFGPNRAYENVTDRTDRMILGPGYSLARKDYFTQNHGLYLLVQETRSALLLTIIPTSRNWTEEEIQELRRQDPEVDAILAEAGIEGGEVNLVKRYSSPDEGSEEE